MKTLLLRGAAALLLAAASTAPNAFADQTGTQATATATTTSYSFSGNPDYGPWTIQSFEYRWQLPIDAPAVTLVDRSDEDRPIASGSRAVYFDDYHTFSKNFYVYAQIGAADGTLLPYRSAYIEGDAKIGKGLVLAAGGSAMQNPDGTTTQYASLGPSIYEGKLVFMLRFMPSNTNGIGTAATQLSVQYNNPRRDLIALTLLNGTQPNVLAGLPANASGFQRVSQATLTVKHWINPNAGFVVGAAAGNFTDASSAKNSYRERGVTFGVFIVPR